MSTALSSAVTVTPKKASAGSAEVDEEVSAVAERLDGRAVGVEHDDHGVDVVGVELAAADDEDVAVGQDREVAGPVVLAGEVEAGDAVGAEGLVPAAVGREAVDDEVDLLLGVGAAAVAGEDVVVALRRRTGTTR